jgi:hypothetical protein
MKLASFVCASAIALVLAAPASAQPGTNGLGGSSTAAT